MADWFKNDDVHTNHSTIYTTLKVIHLTEIILKHPKGWLAVVRLIYV